MAFTPRELKLNEAEVSAYRKYLLETDDDPVKTEEEWTAAAAGVGAVEAAASAAAAAIFEAKAAAAAEEALEVVSTGKNLFNMETVTPDGYMNKNGTQYGNTTYAISDYIRVEEGTQYRARRIRFITAFDADKNVISSEGTDSQTSLITPGTNVRFLRISIYTEDIDTLQFEKGSVDTVYEPYRRSISPNIVLSPTSIDGFDYPFLTPTRNLFDKSSSQLGKYQSNTSDNTSSNSLYALSNLIEVEEGEIYSSSPLRFLTAFDANGSILSAEGVDVNNTVTYTPGVGVRFVKISLLAERIDSFQFERGETRTPYVEFGYEFNDKIFQELELVRDSVFWVPPKLYTTEGTETSIYFAGLTDLPLGQYEFDITDNIEGRHQQERWLLDQVSTGENKATLRIFAKGRARYRLVESTKVVRVGSSAGSGQTPKVLMIGDSLVNAGIITQTVIDNASGDAMGVELLGTRGSGSNRHEGRGGWTFAKYATDYTGGTYGANPFWIGGAVDFGQYLTDNSISAPDFVLFNLGTNETTSVSGDDDSYAAASSGLGHAQTIIDSIHEYDPNIKIGLMTVHPPAGQDGCGSSYGANYSYRRALRNKLIWNKELVATYGDREDDNIFIVPSGCNYDNVNNCAKSASAPINARSSVTIQRSNDAVHPGSEGYQQFGDAVWAFLKCNV